MAYAKKYLMLFSDVYQNTKSQYEVFIYKKDYTGAIYELSGSATPLTIETDRTGDSSYRPVIGSKATVNLKFGSITLAYWNTTVEDWNNYSGTWDSETFDFIEFLTAQSDDFYLEVIKDGNVRWKGFYTQSSDTEISEILPLEFSLTFSDVALMKSTQYYNPSDPNDIGYNASEIVSVETLLLQSVINSGLDMPIWINFPYNIYSADKGVDSEGNFTTKYFYKDDIYLQKTSLLKQKGQYLSYYDILYGICSQFGLVSYQKQNKFYITSYDQLVNETSRSYDVYSSSGVYQETTSVSDTIIALNSSTFKNINRTQSVLYSLPYKYLDISSSVALATNNKNAFLKGYEQYLSPVGTLLDDRLSFYRSSSGNRAFLESTQRATYATIPTYPYNYRIGTRFVAMSATQDDSAYIETFPSLDVSKGDLVSVSYKFELDARNTTPSQQPIVKVALILEVEDDGATSTYYLNDNTAPSSTNTFVTTLTYLTEADNKNIVVPANGKLKLRILKPYCSGYTIGSNFYTYCRYAMIQTYTGNNFSDISKSQVSRSYYPSVKTSGSTSQYSTVGMLFYTPRYYTTPTRVISSQPASYAATISNCFISEDFEYLTDSGNNYSDVNSIQSPVGEGIQRNIGLPNMYIQGSYKSSFYDIGSKFTYTITGFTERTFILLDYRFDAKASEQDSVIYSCEFTDDTDFTFENILITE
jgi:hypothetical protein